MSIINALQTYIKTCPNLKVLTEVHVDEVDGDVVNYSISPLAGDIIVKTDVVGNTYREFPFSLLSREYTVDDLNRLANNGFYQDFSSWMETQTRLEVLPLLDVGQVSTKIEATSWGYLFGVDENATSGVYQINCKLYYKQEV